MREKILGMLRETKDYISGERMSQELGVSRSMVWKVIKGLRDEGYKVDSVTNKGYRLAAVPNLITGEEVRSVLEPKIFGKEIYDYKEVDSTNVIAKAKAREGAKEGTVFIAESQTGGKGRLGKVWESPSGTGIWMSIVVRPEIVPQEVSGITLVAGLAICKAIRKVTSLSAYIKWPNDIVVNGKKVCGILTEMSAEIDRVNYVIIGIGINVNTTKFPEELRKIATSLKIESGIDYSRKDIVAQVLMLFEEYYQKYVQGESLQGALEEYKDLCITLKNEVSIIDKDKSYEATPLDIDKTGALIVEKKDGSIEKITSGEVSVRGIYGYV
ncbi:MAG TPA: biotin--[acetyl-CoA-carboxylase] ligase [Epulopiscium sp.]|nr:biotin--[acetyl-CoA-carboxylase] ligase [Candidatus Epulonipiscium sp.]